MPPCIPIRLYAKRTSTSYQGSNRFFSDLIDEIHQKVRAPGFYPASLDLKGQSLFCIGYYHQRHDLRPGKESATLFDRLKIESFEDRPAEDGKPPRKFSDYTGRITFDGQPLGKFIQPGESKDLGNGLTLIRRI